VNFKRTIGALSVIVLATGCLCSLARPFRARGNGWTALGGLGGQAAKSQAPAAPRNHHHQPAPLRIP
jgi:hypothetical protein